MELYKQGKIRIVSTPTNISVYWLHSPMQSGCVEISCLDNKNWWISRAFVSPKFRNQGVGSHIMKLAIDEVKKHKGKLILVTPGGYEGNTQRQFNFYAKNGFSIPEKKQLPISLDLDLEHLESIMIYAL
jgi:GNAT superfamily N-acetyltransferase